MRCTGLGGKPDPACDALSLAGLVRASGLRQCDARDERVHRTGPVNPIWSARRRPVRCTWLGVKLDPACDALSLAGLA